MGTVGAILAHQRHNGAIEPGRLVALELKTTNCVGTPAWDVGREGLEADEAAAPGENRVLVVGVGRLARGVPAHELGLPSIRIADVDLFAATPSAPGRFEAPD